MDVNLKRNSSLDETSQKVLIAAIEGFMDTHKNSVLCDVCNSPIIFEQIGEFSLKHHCQCGKYNGNLMGL